MGKMNPGPMTYLCAIVAALIFPGAIAEEPCGRNFTTNIGQLTSPGFPNNYTNELNCTWYITLPSGTDRLFIVVSEYDIEPSPNCTYDPLIITDATTNSQLAFLCGKGTEQLTSDSNSVKIEFKTDSNAVRGGWLLVWQRFAETTTQVSPTATSRCGANYTSESGTIESPNCRAPYGNSQQCVWNIQVPAGKKIVLASTDFNLEADPHCHADSLTIINQANGAKIDKICGNQTLMLRTGTNSLRLVFVSNKSVVGKGFFIIWTTCGDVYNQRTGTIHSPNYPNHYSNNLMCVWGITVPNGQIIIRVLDINLENLSTCTYDLLEIWDAVANTSLGKHCDDASFTVQASSNKVMIGFKTNHSVTKKGFFLSWITITEECGRSYHQISGTLYSPNYPGHYNNNVQCTWEITLPTDARMLIDVPVFNLEAHSTCNYDVLEVYDRDFKLGSYCGSRSFSLLTNTNNVRVRLKTDGSVTNTGFTLNWSELQNECGGTYTQQTGKITSPNHPGRYQNRLNCVWYLSLPRSGTIHVSVTNMDVENASYCRYDSLEIYNAANNAMLGKGKYCGNRGFELQTGVNSVKVVFKTDGSVTGSGFSLNWRDSSN